MADERARILIDFVQHTLVTDSGRTVAADTPLLADDLIDSMGLVLLAAFVEERFGVRVDDADLREGRLASIADIVGLLDGRR